jgi:hypothetical protein
MVNVAILCILERLETITITENAMIINRDCLSLSDRIGHLDKFIKLVKFCTSTRIG